MLPSTELWLAVLRVLKPGAPMIAIGAPRTYHRMVTAIEDAGLAVEDMAVWAFAMGRPPSRDRLKPAHAPILIVRRPGGAARLNVEAARLPYVDVADAKHTGRINTLRGRGRRREGIYESDLSASASEKTAFRAKAGRWPANLMLTEDVVPELDRFFGVPKLRAPDGHPAAKPVRLLAQPTTRTCASLRYCRSGAARSVSRRRATTMHLRLQGCLPLRSRAGSNRLPSVPGTADRHIHPRRPRSNHPLVTPRTPATL